MYTKFIVCETRLFSSDLLCTKHSCIINRRLKDFTRLTSKVLVFTSDRFKLFLSFFVGSLKPEKFSRVVTAFFLASIQLGCEVIDFKFPFTNDFVNSLCFLFSSVSDGCCTVNLQLKIFNFCRQPLFSLFKSNNFLVKRFNCFFSFCKTSL